VALGARPAVATVLSLSSTVLGGDAAVLSLVIKGGRAAREEAGLEELLVHLEAATAANGTSGSKPQGGGAPEQPLVKDPAAGFAACRESCGGEYGLVAEMHRSLGSWSEEQCCIGATALHCPTPLLPVSRLVEGLYGLHSTSLAAVLPLLQALSLHRLGELSSDGRNQLLWSSHHGSPATTSSGKAAVKPAISPLLPKKEKKAPEEPSGGQGKLRDPLQTDFRQHQKAEKKKKQQQPKENLTAAGGFKPEGSAAGASLSAREESRAKSFFRLLDPENKGSLPASQLENIVGPQVQELTSGQGDGPVGPAQWLGWMRAKKERHLAVKGKFDLFLNFIEKEIRGHLCAQQKTAAGPGPGAGN